jgi:hypothetical protein
LGRQRYGKNSFWQVSVEIRKIKAVGHVYPNPSSTELTFTASYKITSISISNVVGHIVFSNSYQNDKVQIDVADLPAGMDFVKVNGIDVRKLVKE